MLEKALFKFREKHIVLGRKTYVMGILNVTPDSFSDGGKHFLPEDALRSALDMEKSGADFIDIGGQSTRPGHTPISAEEEWDRLKNILPVILANVSVPVSVDTFYPYVAEKALDLGCCIINDVSGRVNRNMAEVVKKYSAGWVLMHAEGEKTEDICKTVNNRLCELLNQAISFGVKRENICLDPGIGFGKTNEQNLELICNTDRVKVQNNAYLLGASRKRVIGAALSTEVPPENRDFGTVAAHTVGIMGGADIIRVHNVFAALQAVRVADKILKKGALKK